MPGLLDTSNYRSVPIGRGYSEAAVPSAADVMRSLESGAQTAIKAALSDDELLKVRSDQSVMDKTLRVITKYLEEREEYYRNNPEKGDFPVVERTRSGFVDMTELARKIYFAIYSLGEIDTLLTKEDVEDIAVNGNEIYVRTTQGWQEYHTHQQLTLMNINNAIAHSGHTAGPMEPIVDATINVQQGAQELHHRVSVITAPAAAKADPLVVIRKHRPVSFTPVDFVSMPQKERNKQAIDLEPIKQQYLRAWNQSAILTPSAMLFLHIGILAQANTVVLGKTGVGKTALMSMLGNLIPMDRRVFIIEDTPELDMRSYGRTGKASNCAYLKTQTATTEGGVNITGSDLIKAALRQRPDHLIYGETRGAEMWDMINAMQTGHNGNITSVHAHNAKELVDRAYYMISLKTPPLTNLTEEYVAKILGQTFNISITYLMSMKGRRYIASIDVLTGSNGGDLTMETIFAGGKDHNYRLKLQTQNSHIGQLFDREGYSLADVVELADREEAMYQSWLATNNGQQQ